MNIRPDHDLMHTPDASRERWRESYYFMFYDFNSGIGGYSGIGYRPSKGYSGSAHVLWGEDLSTLAASEYATYQSHDAVHPVAGLRYECLEPFKRWSISFDGKLNTASPDPSIPAEVFAPAGKDGLRTQDVSYQLMFVTEEPPYFYRENPQWEGIFDGHIDEVVRVQGKLRIGDRRFDIDGRGAKDHSWGPRDWAAPKGWRFVDLIFEHGPQATLWRATFDGRNWVHDGAIYHEGRVEPITFYAEAVTFAERPGGPDRPDGFEFEIRSLNRTLRGSAKVMRVAPLRFNIRDEEGKKAMMWNDRTVFRCTTDDGRTGIGSAEFQFRVPESGEAPRPLLAPDKP